MQTTVLVTGGAGYIGSHTARQLLNAGHDVVVIDNLYSGHAWAVPADATFIRLNAGDLEPVREVIRDHDIAAVVHFAGHIVVPESVGDPIKYYENNVVTSLRLIRACRDTGVRRFIFSSSAAVYGTPEEVPVVEQAATLPINPYGFSKLATEWMLRDVAYCDLANGRPRIERFNYIALRYFNVAGAALDGLLGQATPEATHLIKVACETACGKRDGIDIFGTDYDTDDGTCVRDYIHVEDLADAHVAALAYLMDRGESHVLNCGYGRGFSVRQVLDTVQRVSGESFKINEAPRRPGDPPILIAEKTRIQELLGWQPRYDDLELICRTAFEWESKLEQIRQTQSDRTETA